MANIVELHPRAMKPATDPLGLYLYIARGDSRCVQHFLDVRGAHFHGMVIDARRLLADKELRELAATKRIDVVLDPKTQESAAQGAFNEKLGMLPWGVGRPHQVPDFQGTAGRRCAAQLASVVADNAVTKVLSPSHLIRDADDEWFETDLEMAGHLRGALDKANCGHIPIAYSLAVPYAVVRDAGELQTIVERVNHAPIDEIWLKIEGFGSDASPTGVKKYIEAVRLFHETGKPLIADHAGGLVGLSLLAFGGVGGLAHGLTLKERFSASHWQRAAGEAPPFSQHHRVYFPELDLFMKPRDAERLLHSAASIRSRICCRDPSCCTRGIADMLGQSGKHFLNQRIRQVARLNEVPQRLRPSVFMEEFLRKASDQAMAVSNVRTNEDAFAKRVTAQRIRLDAMRDALTEFAEKKPATSFCALPQTRVVREARHHIRPDDRRPSL